MCSFKVILRDIFTCGTYVLAVILRHPSLETEGGTMNPATVETLYKDRVTKQLQEMKTMLCCLFPLNFRWVGKLS
jgi:hypothetical protein